MNPEDARTRSVLVGAGLVAGTASGLLGVGGGVVLTPILVGLIAYSQHRAHVTSLAAMVPVAATAGGAFAFSGDVDLPFALVLAAGAVAGAPLGARVMARTSEAALRVAYGVLMILLALSVALGA